MITRQWLTRALAAVAIAASIVTVTQPFYAQVAPFDLKSVGLDDSTYVIRDYFVAPKVGTSTADWVSGVLKLVLVLATAAVVAGSLLTRRQRRLVVPGVITAFGTAFGLSLYVLVANDALWWDGLTWLWVVVSSLIVTAASAPPFAAEPSGRSATDP